MATANLVESLSCNTSIWGSAAVESPAKRVGPFAFFKYQDTTSQFFTNDIQTLFFVSETYLDSTLNGHPLGHYEIYLVYPGSNHQTASCFRPTPRPMQKFPKADSVRRKTDRHGQVMVESLTPLDGDNGTVLKYEGRHRDL